MVEEWLEDFLFRGRPPSGAGAEGAPAWHVIIGQQVDSGFNDGEKSRRLIGPLTIVQAEAAGWPLARVINGVNDVAAKRVTELEAVIAARDIDVAELQGKVAALQYQLDASVVKIADRDAQIEELRARSIQPN